MRLKVVMARSFGAKNGCIAANVLMSAVNRSSEPHQWSFTASQANKEGTPKKPGGPIDQIANGPLAVNAPINMEQIWTQQAKGLVTWVTKDLDPEYPYA